MRFEVSDRDIKKANIPHEIFLTNLIGNHILMAVAAGGVAGSFPWVMAVIPSSRLRCSAIRSGGPAVR